MTVEPQHAPAPSAPESGASRDAGLLIRVWTESDDPDVVRARMLTYEGTDEPQSWCTAAGEQDVLAALEQWVRTQLRGQTAASTAASTAAPGDRP
jgi:hypothetical protein